MKVYVVAESDYEIFEASFRAVFSTKAKAERFIKEIDDNPDEKEAREEDGVESQWVIEECELDCGDFLYPCDYREKNNQAVARSGCLDLTPR